MKKTRRLFVLLLVILLLFPSVNAWALVVAEEEEFASDNLLINGNAENGMEGWTDPDNLWYPTSVITPHEGKYFFWPSKSPCKNTYIYQDVDITEYEVGSWVELTGWLANWDQSPNDEAVLQLEFLDASAKVLYADARSQRNPKWNKHSIQAQIPKQAVTARVKLIANRYVGSDNDAYFDDICLTIVDGTYHQVYITGNKDKAEKGVTIQLTANNGTTAEATNFIWSSSYDSIATVDEKGLVTFYGTASDEVAIYAEDIDSGFIGVYYINSEKANAALVPGQVKSLQKSKVTTSSISLKWSKTANAEGYLVYQYDASKKKWKLVKTITKQNTTTVTISKLKKGTTYKFKVVAYSEYGEVTYKGQASKTVTVSTVKK